MYDEKLPGIQSLVKATWDETIMPAMMKYLEVPNQSPNYDPEERKNGLTEQAMAVLVDWVKAQDVEGMEVHLMEEAGKTPFLLVDIKSTATSDSKTLLMYGHMDKQPPMEDTAPGWMEGLGAYTPVVRDGKLYGRGGADDGYAVFAAITSVRALQKAGLPHGKIVVAIEACEESGSFDLPHWIEKSRGIIGDVDLVVCLDSGTLDYDTMYITTSLRGVCGGRLSVSLLKEGLHSGLGGGIVPDSFRVARMILSRLEDEATGDVKCAECHAEIPQDVKDSFKYLDSTEKKLISGPIATLDGIDLQAPESLLALRNAWMPCVTVVGADGLPSCASAGNVVRQTTALQLSVRLPPIVDPHAANMAVQKLLTANPPYNAKVTYEPEFSGPGWAAPPLQPWCKKLLETASRSAFSRPLARLSVGGSIPFMGMLGDMYPAAQFCITGILGPQSNAHGPNEFLHIDYTQRLIVGLTRVLFGHANESR
ncbi:Cys-Gly metallodipeptidase DUG1 [Diplonema papillatum]|nr:Cys-Gly metallodipeptidase DUG1 [Diplonema papillatum]